MTLDNEPKVKMTPREWNRFHKNKGKAYIQNLLDQETTTKKYEFCDWYDKYVAA